MHASLARTVENRAHPPIEAWVHHMAAQICACNTPTCAQTAYVRCTLCWPRPAPTPKEWPLTSSTLPPMWNTHTVPADTMILSENVDLATCSAMGSLALVGPNA